MTKYKKEAPTVDDTEFGTIERLIAVTYHTGVVIGNKDIQKYMRQAWDLIPEKKVTPFHKLFRQDKDYGGIK